MPELLTDNEISELNLVGYKICSTMLRLCLVADLTDDTEKVNDSLVDAWGAIAEEYGEAFFELEANRTLLERRKYES
jgi:hypothetical protein